MFNKLFQKSSEENKLLQSYFNSILEKQTKVDSVQMVYFDAVDKKPLQKMYADRLNDLNSLQSYFEQESEGKFANDIINVTKKYNSPEILETVESYLDTLETHYFDHIDFSNKAFFMRLIYLKRHLFYKRFIA